MKKTVFLRSTLRQPIRSLLILFLVGVISFSFVSRMGEYDLISQEQERLSQYYRSIGTLISVEDSRVISKDVADYLEQAPYIAYTDHRQYTSGVMLDGLYNADTSGNLAVSVRDPDAERIYNLEVFFYGIYAGPEYTSAQNTSSSKYDFVVDEVISGYPEYVTDGKRVALYVEGKEFGDRFSQLKNGERYLLRASMDPDSILALSISYSAKNHQDFAWLPLDPDLGWFLSAPSNLDLAQPEYAQLTNKIQQSHDNACALDITATADMSAMAYVNPQSGSLTQYYLTDGRWLDHEDTLTGRRVIVIHEGLASARNLEIGDTINLKLRDASFVGSRSGQCYAPLLGYQFELQPIGYEFQTQTEAFEIVGIYSSFNANTTGTFAYQKAYIPLSVFPENFTPALAADEYEVYSLILDSPAHEEAFLEATRDKLDAMGYYVTFMPTGYQNFENATEGIRAAAWSNAVIFAVILVACFCLVCFIYFRFRRKDLAISRALGVPAGKCVLSSALPLALVGGVGVVAGSALAWSYTQSNAEKILNILTEAAGAERAVATLSMGALVLIALLLITVLSALTFVFAVIMVKKPVLSQLQGGNKRK